MSRRRATYQPYQPVTRERLHADAFGPARIRRPAPDEPLRLPIRESDVRWAAVCGALGTAAGLVGMFVLGVILLCWWPAVAAIAGRSP